MLMSPSKPKLEGLPRNCQPRLLEVSEVKGEDNNVICPGSDIFSTNVSCVIAALDETDLQILEAVLKSSGSTGVTARRIAESVYLSQKAILKRARKLADIGLFQSRVVKVSEGAIQPAAVFSPAPCLREYIAQRILTKEAEPVSTYSVESNGKTPNIDLDSSNALDDLDATSLMILGLIGFGIASKADEIFRLLGLTHSPVRKRLKLLTDDGYLEKRAIYPNSKRPGSKKLIYTLSPFSTTKEDIRKALENVDPSNLPPDLDPEVDWASIGVSVHKKVVQGSHLQVANHKVANFPSAGIAEEDGRRERDSQVQENRDEKKSRDLWRVLREMASKIAEQDKRIAALEVKNVEESPQEVQEILDMLYSRSQ